MNFLMLTADSFKADNKAWVLIPLSKVRSLNYASHGTMRRNSCFDHT